MKLKKLFAMLMALAMVAGLLAACSNDTGNASTPPASEPVSDSQAPESDAPESEAPALDPVTLNVAYMPNYGSLWAVIAAQELGYFEDEAITVNLMSFDSGPVIISAMESGSVDFGYIGDGAHSCASRARLPSSACPTSPTATQSSEALTSPLLRI